MHGAVVPLQFYNGWFMAFVYVWMGVCVAVTIYQTRRRRLGERILEVVAVVCITLAFGQAAGFHVGMQAIEWAAVGAGVIAAFAVLLAPLVLIQRTQQSDQEPFRFRLPPRSSPFKILSSAILRRVATSVATRAQNRPCQCN
jgi:peptidoglycan/LPS O-acetylase OafA/YrhL